MPKKEPIAAAMLLAATDRAERHKRGEDPGVLLGEIIEHVGLKRGRKQSPHTPPARGAVRTGSDRSVSSSRLDQLEAHRQRSQAACGCPPCWRARVAGVPAAPGMAGSPRSSR